MTLLSAAVTGILWTLPAAATSPLEKGDAGVADLLAAKGDAGVADPLSDPSALAKGDAGVVDNAEAIPMGDMADAGGKHACKGQNACKGQGGCKTDKHGCKGQNACKGQGGCRTDGKK